MDAPKLSILGDQHLRATWFVTATIVWTLFVLQDSVLTGLGEAPWVLLENAVYGVVKLLALVAVAVWFRAAGVFVAWTVAALPARAARQPPALPAPDPGAA